MKDRVKKSHRKAQASFKGCILIDELTNITEFTSENFEESMEILKARSNSKPILNIVSKIYNEKTN